MGNKKAITQFDGCPGWDDRKELASIFQDHQTLNDNFNLSDEFYHALIAVAKEGFKRAIEIYFEDELDDSSE